MCSNILSTGKIAEGIGLAAMSRGWDSYIAYGMKKNNPSKSKTIKIGGDNYLFTSYLETLLFDNHSLGLSNRRATKKLLEEILKINPDIIQLHTIHCYYLNIRVLFDFLATKNIPIVWTLHDCWAFTGHCAHFDYVKCNKWQTVCNNCPQKNKYPKSLLFDRSKKNFKEKERLYKQLYSLTIVSVSKWLQNLLAYSILKKNASLVIYNGINLNTFIPNVNNKVRESLNLGNKFIMIAVASSWSERKGFSDYCRLATFLNNDEYLIMLGVEKKQIPNNMPNTLFVEKTYNVQELVDFYSAADVVLNLSYEESFGMTTVEGLACGTPGIVYNRTASPELISKDTGIIVEAGNIDQLLKAIREVKHNGKEFYSNSCRNRAIELFDQEKNFNKYIDLYNQLIQNESSHNKL